VPRDLGPGVKGVERRFRQEEAKLDRLACFGQVAGRVPGYAMGQGIGSDLRAISGRISGDDLTPGAEHFDADRAPGCVRVDEKRALRVSHQSGCEDAFGVPGVKRHEAILPEGGQPDRGLALIGLVVSVPPAVKDENPIPVPDNRTAKIMPSSQLPSGPSGRNVAWSATRDQR